MIFSLLQITMSFLAAVQYGWQGDVRHAIYWVAAGVIGLAVTVPE